MKNAIIWLTAGFLICLLLMEFVCNKPPAPAVDPHIVDSLKSQLKARDSKIIADSLAYEEARKSDDSDRSAWLETKEFIEKRMANQIASLTFSVNKYRTASLAKDTSEQLIDCNQIVKELDSVYLQALSYKKVIDSLQQNATDRRGIDSSELNILRQGIVQDGLQMEEMVKTIDKLMKENAELRKLMSKNKKARWLWSAISAILGGFLVNEIKK